MSATGVSVCVTTRGRLPLLRQSLAGILAQDHAPLEIVVSDNCSEDGTREYLMDLATRDARVHYVRPAEPLGLYANHNFALGRTTGRYVCFFHDDDLYGPTVVSRYAAFLDAHPSVAFVCSDRDRIDLDGRVVGRQRYGLGEVTPGVAYIDQTLAIGTSAIALSGSMFRREALGDRPFDEDGPLGFTDVVTWFRIAESRDVGYVRERLWSYRTHPGALSNTSPERIAADHSRAFGAYCDEYLGRHPNDAARVRRWRRAIERYRFWVLLYAAAAHMAAAGTGGGQDDASALASHGPVEWAALWSVRVLGKVGWRWPLSMIARYGATARGLIGFR